MAMIGDLIKYSKLAFELREFVKSTISLQESEQVIAARIHNRNINLRDLIQKGIYQNPKSPYRELLKYAGCEFGDIEKGISQYGIEHTLAKLITNGVYISWEEFKGKREVIRGGRHFQFSERDFDNPFLPNYYQVRSSGTRSAGTRTTFDLNYTLEKSYYRLPLLHAFNAESFPMGFWLPILPSSAGVAGALQGVKIGQTLSRWFTPVNERQVKALFRDLVALRYIIYASRLWGAKIPWPEWVSLEHAVTIANWMAEAKKRFGGCSLRTNTSLAVMVCQAAAETGIDISGTHFQIGGEPLTETKLKWIKASGASVAITYHISEIGWIGCGCPKSTVADDIHLFHDSTALIQRHRKVDNSELEVEAFVFTSLLPSTPKILLNVENDDYGMVETKSCGCIFDRLGFNRHVSHVRSFSKLTGRGMTIIGSDFLRILEDVLPNRFGGAPTDYQLQEVEDSSGKVGLILAVAPEVGQIDERVLIKTVLVELQHGVQGGKLASGIWSQAEALQVVRSTPISSCGKVMPLHLQQTKVP